MIDRIPPQAVEIERVVLGTCLIDKNAVDFVTENCRAEFFYSTANIEIFRTIKEMNSKGKQIDLVLLDSYMESTNINPGVRETLSELCESICTIETLPQYVETLKKMALLRALINSASTILDKAFNPDADPEEIIQQTEQKFLDISSERTEEGFKLPSEILPKVFADYEKRQGGEVVGLPTGFIDLDNQTGGLERGDLVIVAGRPAMGKTSWAVQVAINAARAGKIVAVFSLEMNKQQIVQRILAVEASVNLLLLRTGKLPAREVPKLAIAAGTIMDFPIYIDDFAMGNTGSILSKCRRLKKIAGGLDLVIVDYLQLMDGDSRERAENRQQEITKISRGLKQAAKFLDVPVMPLCQLSRSCEMRANKRPQLSDLRESGAIEQDADLVLFLYRHEIYDPVEENSGKAELIIGKQRNGPIGTVPLTFIKHCARFENYTEQMCEQWQDKI